MFFDPVYLQVCLGLGSSYTGISATIRARRLYSKGLNHSCYFDGVCSYAFASL